MWIFLMMLLLLNPELSEVRLKYKEAVVSKDSALSLYNELGNVEKTDNKTLVSYKGALMAITAKYAQEVQQKKELFKKGVRLIEYAVNSEPNNIEIRFVRLSIQQNSPRFLKYNSSIDLDKKFILGQINLIGNTELKAYISDYILQSNNFTASEKSLLKQ